MRTEPLMAIAEYLRIEHSLDIKEIKHIPVVIVGEEIRGYYAFEVSLEVRSDLLMVQKTIICSDLRWNRWTRIFKLADPDEFDEAITFIVQAVKGSQVEC